MEKTKELITQHGIPSQENFNLAITWIEEQVSKTTQFASQVAGISMHDPARIAWLGINPHKWNDEIENLSFRDEEPPWIFDLQINFRKRQLNPDALKVVKERIRLKVGDMRCKIHKRAAHICLKGNGPDDFEFNVEACCAEFGEAVHRKVTPEKANMKSRPNRIQ